MDLHTNKRTLLWIGTVVLIGAIAILVAQLPYTSEDAEKARVLRDQGSALWSEGRMSEAREAFAQGKRHVSSPEEKAVLDIYIASTYVEENPFLSVDTYLSIVNNESYPLANRSYAGALLLALLRSSADSSLTEHAFSKPPFVGMLREESVSAYLNREAAYSRAHHFLVSSYAPNFLSLLTAGSIYAYLYPHVDEGVRAEIGPRIHEYFVSGRGALERSSSGGAAHSSIVALGYKTLAEYSRDYEELVSEGLLEPSSEVPDRAFTDAAFRRAMNYAQDPAHAVGDITAMTIALGYAHFLEGTQAGEGREARLRTLASDVASYAVQDAPQAFIREIVGTTVTIGPFSVYRESLSMLSEYNSELRVQLESLGGI